MRVIDTINIYGGMDLQESTPLLVLDITDSCTRNAAIGGDNFVHIVSNSEQFVELNPLSYIKYEGEYFYLKSVYRPSDIGGGIYLYEMNFYKVDNILELFVFQRIATVTDKDGNVVTWKEAEFDLNANKKSIGDVVCASIQDSMARLNAYKIFIEIGGIQLANNADYSKTKLIAWSFSGNTIKEALDNIATEFECDWWIDGYTLYIEKRENENNTISISDQWSDTYGRPQGNESGGIASIAYESEQITRSGRVFPIGSDRNIKREQATWNGMNISYNRRLTLRPNTSYPIALSDGTTDVLTTDAEGAVVFGDTIGQESVVEFEDVYPKQVFQVTHVSERQGAEGKTQYLVTCAGTGSVPPEFLNKPIQQAAGVAQTITFESGRLNGFKFDIFLQGKSMTYRTFDFTIVPQVTDNVYLPSGTLIPMRGDTFALAGIIMPDYYVESARQELAAKIYETIEQLKRYQPSVRIVLEPTWVYNNIQSINIGDVVEVESTITGTEVYRNRIIRLSYPLTFPENVTITLAERIDKGILKEREEQLNNLRDGFERRYNPLSDSNFYVKDVVIKQSDILKDHGVQIADLDRDVQLFGEIAANTKERVGTLQGFLAGISNSNYRVGYADFSTTSTIEQTEPTMLRVMQGTMTNGEHSFAIPETYINLYDLDISDTYFIHAIANDELGDAEIVVKNSVENGIRVAANSYDLLLARLVYLEDYGWQWHYARGRALSIGDDVQIGSIVTDVDKESEEIRRYKNVTVAAKAMYVDRELVLSDRAAKVLIERLREFGL